MQKTAKRAVSDGLLEEGHCEAILTVVSDVGYSARSAVLGEILGEQHCQEILSVLLGAQYSAWLTTAQARDELVRDITISAPDTRHTTVAKSAKLRKVARCPSARRTCRDSSLS